jgi:alkaline phosphatase
MRWLPLLALVACRPSEVEPLPYDTSESGEVLDETGESPEPSPRAVILFIGDGMGFEHVEGGGLYAYGEAGSLVMEGMPSAGRLRTASLTGYTDSAASATAMATGHKTYNAMLGMNRDSEPVTTLLELARSEGLSGGLVTTDTLTGATPSAFQIHTSSRYDTNAVVAEWLIDPPDLALGGGADNLLIGMSKLDVQLLGTPEELALLQSDGRPVVGLFATSTFPFVYDTLLPEEEQIKVEDVPALSEMVLAAIELLSENEDGFFLMVEGARIDHASHGNASNKVHLETAEFDAAVATALEWADGIGDPDFETTILVTADHECGGMEVSGSSAAGETPETTWRWTDHTNADVPIFGYGDRTTVFDGERLDNTWVHAVLSAAIQQSELVDPDVPRVVDGWTEDLGDALAVQIHNTSFGTGFNQLDALRLSSDADGIWLGVDGVFERDENAVVVLIDLDYPSGTGLLAESSVVLEDTEGTLDSMLTELNLDTDIEGLGFDVALASIGGREVRDAQLSEDGGLRGLHSDWGETTDLWWLSAITNFDDGNISKDGPALDAGATGETEGGFEALVPWSTIFKEGLPSGGTTIAVAAILVNSNGQNASNQALPPYAVADEPGVGTMTLTDVATLTVDQSGEESKSP